MLGCTVCLHMCHRLGRRAGKLVKHFIHFFLMSSAHQRPVDVDVDVDLGCRRGPFLPVKQRRRVPAAMAQVPFSTLFFLLLSGVSTFKFDKHKSLAVEASFLQLGATVKVTVPNLAT